MFGTEEEGSEGRGDRGQHRQFGLQVCPLFFWRDASFKRERERSAADERGSLSNCIAKRKTQQIKMTELSSVVLVFFSFFYSQFFTTAVEQSYEHKIERAPVKKNLLQRYKFARTANVDFPSHRYLFLFSAYTQNHSDNIMASVRAYNCQTIHHYKRLSFTCITIRHY